MRSILSFKAFFSFFFLLGAAEALSTAQKLLDLASQQKTIVLPGVHDALSAKIFHRAGAEALFLSGFGVSATKLGVPDAGILTLSEMEDCARTVCSSSSPANGSNDRIPVVVDGDTGYGGTPNMRRTVRGLAAAGAAAITIEDQMFPKKCCYAAGEAVRVVSRGAAIARIQCALEAAREARERDGNHVLIVGRTDCRAAHGYEEALARCQVFEELGADIVYAENLQSRDEYTLLREKITKPMVLAQVQLGGTATATQTLYGISEIESMGYNFALFGISGLQAQVAALQQSAQQLLSGETTDDESSLTASFSTIKEIVDFTDLEEFEQKFYCE